ncbi:FAD-dependent oxidoreductase [uncultured Sulfitobacter sp.]|uniref:NAD(P)/FAD-dependent oxidoreductase n=1 Tax=uncultured Sulfitobacter sp. TaxID=191468 RepID=UPI00261DABEA|nr:FAD-dependent oxidoreductase [uncultured Sulfitobacter sp.]
MSVTGPSVIVVGAGIIGAAVADALQSAGARVIVVDSGAASATAASFGWINASFHHDTAHFRLRHEGLAAWHRLQARLELPVVWQGTLCWEETGAAFDAERDRLSALGYDLHEVDRDAFAALEPHVATPPERALHFQQEAAADSTAVNERLLQSAVDAGAQRLRGLKVLGLVEQGGRITGIRTEAGITTADHVLIAAGTGSAGLMAYAGAPLPMVRRPALVLRSRPVAPLLRHILVSEFGELRQLPDGTLLMPAAVDHQGDTSEVLTSSLEDTAADVLVRLRALLGDKGLDWQELTLAHRPVPQDGLPVIGAVREGLHVACMHSGITLGALAGELVAHEMLEGVSNTSGALLAPYRPARFGG